MKLQHSRILLALLATAVVAFVDSSRADAVELKSPDGKLVAQIEVNEQGNIERLVSYRVAWQGRDVIVPSSLGLQIDEFQSDGGVSLLDVRTVNVDRKWQPVYGERSEIRDRYNEVTLRLRTEGDVKSLVEVVFRAYDEGLAFCYRVPEQTGVGDVRIKRERSEFRFTGDHRAWVAYRAQANYQQARISEIKPGCERPLPIQAGDDLFLAIGEAALVDYARMKLAPLPGSEFGLVSELQGEVVLAAPLQTPWRFVMTAENAGGLLERNYLVLNLNEPCAIADTSWIKPGKVIREVTLTTQGGKALVDFAARRGLQYVHFDAGWYGHEYDDASDATTVTVDPKRSKGPLELQEVIAYAKERGIGVIVYVNRRALEKQLDDILPLYKSWGISGVKYGFVNVGSQEWTAWLHEAIRKAAAHQLMVDVHDEYRMTGYERTYPNFMTAEGIAGDETSPKNANTLMILFSRMLCGPADHTICYFDSRVDNNATHAYQLAKAVCFYSPWQYLYWYDRPAQSPHDVGGAGGGNKLITDVPELEFFDAVPTTWDETRVVHGEIGRYAVIARRSKDEWYVGAMNGDEQRTLTLPLDFLSPDKQYTAHRYIDDPTVQTRTKVRVATEPVTCKTQLTLELSAQGGQAIRITPR